MLKMIDITLKRSPIGAKAFHKATVRALGLKRIGQTVRQKDDPAIRGMIRSIAHLVTSDPANDGDAD